MIFWRAWSRKWLPCGNIFRCNSVVFFPSVFSTSLPLLSHVSQVLHSRPGRPQSSTVYSTPLSEPQYIPWIDEMIWSDTTGCFLVLHQQPTTSGSPFSIFEGIPVRSGFSKSPGREICVFWVVWVPWQLNLRWVGSNQDVVYESCVPYKWHRM